MNEFSTTKTVILAGATGLVGGNLLEVLLTDISIGKIYVLSRREILLHHKKVEVVITGFDDLTPLAGLFEKADVVFCCVGTTIRKAGTQEEFRRVDYEIPVILAKISSEAGVKKFIVVSSIGANENSGNFYLKTKGEMEAEVSAFRFPKLAFVRPSVIIGQRNEFRFGERAGQVLLVLFSFLLVGPLRKFRPIESMTIAKAMFSISHSLSNQKVYESTELQWLGK